MKGFRFALALLAALIPASALAEPTFPDRNGKAVVDAASAIPDDQERVLNDKIVKWVKANGAQFAVVTVPSLQGYAIEDYGNRLLRSYALGRKGVNDGAILLWAPTERKVRIEVGYGLEPVLTDAATSVILRETIVPRLKAGDGPGAMAAGTTEVLKLATPTKVEAAVAAQKFAAAKAETAGGWGWIWMLVGGVVVLIVAAGIFLPRRRKFHTGGYVNADEWERNSIGQTPAMLSPPRVMHRGTYNDDAPPPPAMRVDDDVIRHVAAVNAPAAAVATAARRPRPTPPPPAPPRKARPTPTPSPTPTPTPDSAPWGYGAGASSFFSSSDWGSSSSSSSDSGSGSYDSGGGSSGGGGSSSDY